MVYFSGNNTDLDVIINVVPYKANAKTEICMKEIYGGGDVREQELWGGGKELNCDAVPWGALVLF